MTESTLSLASFTAPAGHRRKECGYHDHTVTAVEVSQQLNGCGRQAEVHDPIVLWGGKFAAFAGLAVHSRNTDLMFAPVCSRTLTILPGSCCSIALRQEDGKVPGDHNNRP